MPFLLSPPAIKTLPALGPLISTVAVSQERPFIRGVAISGANRFDAGSYKSAVLSTVASSRPPGIRICPQVAWRRWASAGCAAKAIANAHAMGVRPGRASSAHSSLVFSNCHHLNSPLP